MGIIVNQEMPPEIYPGAVEKAAEMRAILEADLIEQDAAKLVQEFYVGDVELEIAAWQQLKWKEQEAWRAYRGMRLHQD